MDPPNTPETLRGVALTSPAPSPPALMSGPISLTASNNRAWQSQPAPKLARGSMPVESNTEDYPHAGKQMQAGGL